MEIELKEVGLNRWEVPKKGEMLVPGMIYGDRKIIEHLKADLTKDWNALSQIVNVAHLPGIQKASLAMSDVHPGYGFPIGGVGAFDIETGIISMAGVGYDINCGVRTLKTPMKREELEPRKEELINSLFQRIPAGLGSTGKIRLSEREIDELLVKGAKYTLEKGYGTEEDLEFTEERGCIAGADPSAVSHKAKERQFKQVGTLGSGNHYLEVQWVDEIFDEEGAKAFGLFKDQILISIHCGSRALGHQIGTDYLKILEEASKKYGIKIRDRELVCAPFKSDEGKRYFSAVKAGINCAFANRHVLGHLTRKTFAQVMGIKEDEIKTFYDIGHNTCKLEEHDGKKLIVHRKGATRAFGPGRGEVPKPYQNVGQPVLIGGTMGTFSYILHGTQVGMDETFGSACHGAGRLMSRVKAKKRWWAKELIRDLKEKGILIRGHSLAGVAEEAPGAYKDVTEVVEVLRQAGIVKNVARLRPLCCIKG